MKKRNKLFILVLIFVLILGNIIYSNNHLTFSQHSVETDLSTPIRIIQLSDLHNKKFGENNKNLIKKILEQKPDIVVMTGDMVNSYQKDLTTVTSLIRELSKSIPVYFSLGNHEISYQQNFDVDLKEIFENTGAVVLDYEYADVSIKGNNLRIGGYYGYYRTPHLDTTSAEQKKIMSKFSNEFEDTDIYKLLLCHIPTTWVDWDGIDDYPVNLVLCGHYHGGQIRIPFVGGLHAPYVGWFPKNTKGMFVGEKATCILTTGLGSGKKIPRINNPPEIVIIDLL